MQSGAAVDPAWASILKQALQVNPNPQDPLDLAAILESLGWTDRRAEESFGYGSVFRLAEELMQSVRETVRSEPLRPLVVMPWYRLVWRMLAQFLHGLTFALPMAVSTLAMIILHVSYIASLSFAVSQATALALATFLSYVSTGGFIQSMAHSVYLFVGLGEPNLASRISWRFIRWGVMASAFVSLAFLLGDILFRVVPLSLILFMGLYQLLLSALWLSFAGLYVLRREYLLVFITGGASLLTYFIWQHNISLILAQAASLVAASVASIGITLWLLLRMSRLGSDQKRVVEPRTSQIAFTTYAYFTYGILYFVFVYVDRIMSWSTNSGYMPYYLWFRGEYELGMDWAILTLILPLGIAEVLIQYLHAWVQARDQVTPARETASFARALQGMYMRLMLIFGVVACIAVWMTHVAVNLGSAVPSLREAAPIVGVEPFVLTWASVGYAILAIALFNVLLMFSLSMPVPALQGLAGAVVINFLVGLFLTRTWDTYSFAVWGLVAGSAYLLAASTRSVWRLLPEIDFLLYRMV